MIGVSGFVARVEQIAARKPTYRIGGVGRDGTCDCIGLVMGAMYELGQRAYDLHSTNYFARFQTLELKKVNEKELHVGQLLYRARDNQDNLHARYLPSGRYYTGDILDYYHVGIVTGIKPLRVVECTEHGGVSGIKISDTIKNWHYGGKLRNVLYDESDIGGLYEKETEEDEVVLYKAKVATQDDPLTLRATPNGRKIGKLPIGAIVDVLAGGEWSRVRYGDMLGYAASEFLDVVEMEEQPKDQSSVITIVDSEGNRFQPVGDFRVLIGSVD